MTSSYWIQTEDWHTAGEPFRIVDQLPTGSLPGASTVAERRFAILKTPGHPLDILRQQLCHEPRGHADMYGGFITPPNDSGAHFGVLFWHADGFSTACGHGTMALGYWAVTKGLVKAPEGDGVVDVVVDVPSGRVIATVTVKQGKPVHADFVNVLSYQLERDLKIEVPSLGISISASLSFGGAVYATVDAAQFGLRVEPKNAIRFIDLGREIKKVLGTRAHYEYSVLLLGLDNAGKTTLLEQIKACYTPSHPNLKTVPTVGQNTVTLALPPPNPPIYLKLWDVGGQHSLRGLWTSYYSAAHAIVFVLDSSDVGNATLSELGEGGVNAEEMGRLDEARLVLESILGNEETSGVPILVLANKQDREDCVEVVRIKEGFVRKVFEGEKGGNVRDSRVLPCSALTGTGVNEAVEWLVTRMMGNKELRPPVMR
ncbi:hypothetical protein E8E12_005089 [Didymella heteroderae]|uniref:trans-L-3-hydroxyproline dehydratase n=1 Tax=Didymella heteroderae TaxID=1769908 RepID=A0A9P4WJS7_9PLEO|nr:hypothetical protein E8E12_005089 [Didymella heteroderae]